MNKPLLEFSPFIYRSLIILRMLLSLRLYFIIFHFISFYLFTVFSIYLPYLSTIKKDIQFIIMTRKNQLFETMCVPFTFL